MSSLLFKACDRRPHLSFLDYADTAEAAFIDAGGRWAKWGPFIRCVTTLTKIVNEQRLF